MATEWANHDATCATDHARLTATDTRRSLLSGTCTFKQNLEASVKDVSASRVDDEEDGCDIRLLEDLASLTCTTVDCDGDVAAVVGADDGLALAPLGRC